MCWLSFSFNLKKRFEYAPAENDTKVFNFDNLKKVPDEIFSGFLFTAVQLVMMTQELSASLYKGYLHLMYTALIIKKRV